MKPVSVRSAAVILAAALSANASAQDSTGNSRQGAGVAVPAYRLRVLGVFDATSGEPVEGVEVIDVLTGTKAVSTRTGTVSLFFLPDGGSLVRLRKVGYEVQTLPVSISPADTTPLTVILTRTAMLPAVIVKDSAPTYLSPALRGFEERRRQGFGHFVTEAEFRKNDNKRLMDVLLPRIPGVMTAPGPHGETYLVSARKPCQGPAFRSCRTADCYVSVYQDGIRLYDATVRGSQVPDFARMSAIDYAGAEYYAGGAAMPPEFNATSSGCGTLLLWTRER